MGLRATPFVVWMVAACSKINQKYILALAAEWGDYRPWDRNHHLLEHKQNRSTEMLIKRLCLTWEQGNMVFCLICYHCFAAYSPAQSRCRQVQTQVEMNCLRETHGLFSGNTMIISVSVTSVLCTLPGCVGESEAAPLEVDAAVHQQLPEEQRGVSGRPARGILGWALWGSCRWARFGPGHELNDGQPGHRLLLQPLLNLRLLLLWALSRQVTHGGTESQGSG